MPDNDFIPPSGRNLWDCDNVACAGLIEWGAKQCLECGQEYDDEYWTQLVQEDLDLIYDEEELVDSNYVLPARTDPTPGSKLFYALCNVCCDKPPSVCTCASPIMPEDIIDYGLIGVYAAGGDCWRCTKQGEPECPPLRNWIRTFEQTNSVPGQLVGCDHFELDMTEHQEGDYR